MMIVWADILRFANEGNAAPGRRLEKTDTEWQAILTTEQYRITRAKGTESGTVVSFVKFLNQDNIIVFVVITRFLIQPINIK